MGIVIRQSLKASIVSYVGAFIGYLNIMFITPYCLSPEIVGFNKVFLDAALLFTFIAQLGLNSAMVRFFPYFIDGRSNKGFLSLIIFIPLAGFLLLTAIIFIFYSPIIGLFKTNSALFSSNFYYVIPLTFFVMYLGLLETYSACHLRIVVPKIIKEVILRILNIAIIVALFLKIIDFQIFIISIICIYAIAVFLNLYYLSKISNLSIKPQFENIPKPVFRNFMYYTLFILFVGIGSNIVNKVDVFMISSSINLAYTGIFSIAFYITTIIEIPSRAFMQITNPLIAEASKNNDYKTIANIYTKSSLNQYLVGGILLLLIWVNADNIFSIMPNGQIYQVGKYVILFLGLSKVFDMVTGVNWLIISNSKYYYYQVFFIIYLTILTVVLNYYLIPLYGINGAGVASLIALGSYNIILLLFLKLKSNLWPLNIQTLKLTLIFVSLFALNVILPTVTNPIIDGAYRSMVISLLFLALIYFGNISDDINKIIKNINLKNIKRSIPKSFFK